MVDQVRNGKKVRAVQMGATYKDGGWYEVPSGKVVRGADRAIAVMSGGRRSAVMNATEKLLRERFAGLAGLTHGDNRDVYEVAGYPNEYTFSEGWDRYRRQDIARRIVDLPVQKTWRHRPQVLDGEEEETEFTEAFDEVWDELSLSAVFERADRMAAIGEFSVVFLGFAGTATDRQLKTAPDGDLDGPDDVLYARPYKQSNVSISKWVTDAAEERFGKPEVYSIDLSGGGGRSRKEGFKASLGKVDVHWTRVLHIVEDPMDSAVFGMPRLERVLNRLIDLEKISASTAEAFWQLAVKILQVSIDPEAALKEDDWDNLDDEMEELAHDLRRHFLGQGVDMEFLGGDTPDPSGPSKLYMMLISAASGIPMRVLFGTETGERASEQDERAFLGMVAERQEQYAEPTIVRQFTDRLILLGALPEPTSGEYSVVWRNLFEQTEKQEAEIDKLHAETSALLTPMGGDPRTVAEVDEEGRVKLRPTVEAA